MQLGFMIFFILALTPTKIFTYQIITFGYFQLVSFYNGDWVPVIATANQYSQLDRRKSEVVLISFIKQQTHISL